MAGHTMGTLAFSNAKEQLLDTCEQLRKAEERVAELRATRDLCIRDAISNAVPYRTVGAWTGLSRDRLFKISTGGTAA